MARAYGVCAMGGWWWSRRTTEGVALGCGAPAESTAATSGMGSPREGLTGAEHNVGFGEGFAKTWADVATRVGHIIRFVH